ncbi:unnamed protein product [Paramecium pentaurelia]|uniref:Uncharacterized protein n=1 Tax=Paramecium pentaurelia TaxID=43138 RepID=A0A8S1S1I1_9CILI|nr:unnamed protein product [Paramecium pentaurelia]
MKDNSIQSNSSIPFQGLFYYPYGIYLCPVPLPYIKTCQQLQDDRQFMNVKQEVKEEYESEPIQEVCKKHIVKFSPYIYPGETKNYYKNIGKKLSTFIINSFEQPIVKQDPFIIQFIKIQSQNYNRMHFQKLFKSKVALKIARKFFGDFQWCSKFIQQNKTDIDLYFRHNKQMYQRKKRDQSPFKKRITEQNK